ncbi:MAG: hypothetical protein AB7N76_02540 [Planctomycetota bacterium]
MSEGPRELDGVFDLGPGLRLLPVLHGSCDYAARAADAVLSRPWGTLAVALPPAFQEEVEAALDLLPTAHVVYQLEPREPEFLREQGDGDDELPTATFVPVDPTQPVIAALRVARQERIPRAFVDIELPGFESRGGVYPDPYALQRGVSLELFAAALLTGRQPPPSAQVRQRAAHMAARLRELEQRQGPVLFLCSFREWPWVRRAYLEGWLEPQPEPVAGAWTPVRRLRVREQTLTFVLGELPYVAHLHVQARRTLGPEEHLSVDGVKALLLEARDRWLTGDKRVERRLSPQRLSLLLKYVRNLTLLRRRLSPDLYTLAVAAKQVVGDDYAIAVVETAQHYPYQGEGRPWEEASFGLEERAVLPPEGEVVAKSRLPGAEVSWERLELTPPPPQPKREEWRQRWNPYSACSYPPEDARIESFRTHVQELGKAAIGADLARSEKFSTSILDGIDIRETVRHFYSGELWVKRIPPARGSVEVVVFLFDVPADPELYTWRVTWYAEHGDESTLSLFATDYQSELVGPGIGQATYGGAMFLYPPRPIPEVWTDRRLAGARTLEERLIAAGCLHSRERHVVLVSPGVPRRRWRQLAREHGRRLVHLPLRRFSQETVERLRRVHVLNGHEVRSYAAEFIRDL